MQAGPFDLHGTVSVVTGASSGIGADTARALGAAGSSVLLVGRSSQRLAEAAQAVTATGAEADVVAADICADEGPRAVVDAALDRFGRIDVLVHSAGVFLPAPFPEVTPDDFELQWRTNVLAPYRLTQAALPHLSSGSSVVFVSSVSGQFGSPECTAYCATKGAVELLVKSLATELGPRGIRVNAVAPSDVRTPMNDHLFADPAYEQGILAVTPAGRVGAVSDVSPAVVYLASPAAAYVHGVSLPVDGGFAAQ